MTRIIKRGILKPGVEEFECQRCGTVWESDSKTYGLCVGAKDDDGYSYSVYRDTCPICGEKCYKEYKAENSVIKHPQDKLRMLVAKNPGLPVIPMLRADTLIEDTDIGKYGNIEDCVVDEYIEVGSSHLMFLKSKDDKYDVLYWALPTEYFELLGKEESECQKRYDELPWEKAIIVIITL